MIARVLTAEDYEASKCEVAEALNWSELIHGELIPLEPPTPEHGLIVLNISRALAEHLQAAPEGYACFEMGFVVERSPDSVYCAAISYFVAGRRFAEVDKLVTETRPVMIIDVASTPDRRRFMRRRAQEYLQWGVSLVWVIEPRDRLITLHHADRTATVLGPNDVVRSNAKWTTQAEDSPFLEGFEISVANVFREVL